MQGKPKDARVRDDMAHTLIVPRSENSDFSPQQKEELAEKVLLRKLEELF
jgi:hypothetical protein